jgi:hypothetical protein
LQKLKKTVSVTYQHESGETIKSDAVTFGDTLTPPTENIVRLDKDFAGWTLNETLYKGTFDATEFYSDDGVALSDAIKALTSEKKDVVITSTYVAKTVMYTVTVSGGAITQPTELAGQTEVTVENGTHLYATADVPEGKVFNYWTDQNGNKLSNDKVFECYVNSDKTIIAVCSDVEVEAEPIVYFNDNGEVSVKDSAIKFNLSSRIPSSYTKLEWGILLTPYDDVTLTYDLNNADIMVLTDDGTTKTSNDADLRYTFTSDSSLFTCFDTMYACVYAKIQDNTGTTIIYSNVITITW